MSNYLRIILLHKICVTSPRTGVSGQERPAAPATTSRYSQSSRARMEAAEGGWLRRRRRGRWHKWHRLLPALLHETIWDYNKSTKTIVSYLGVLLYLNLTYIILGVLLRLKPEKGTFPLLSRWGKTILLTPGWDETNIFSLIRTISKQTLKLVVFFNLEQ